MNKILYSEQGERIKVQILSQASKLPSTDNTQIQGINGCGYATLAGFAYTTAFAGLMTVAGVSGTVGWGLGAGVGAVWLGAQYAAGCLG